MSKEWIGVDLDKTLAHWIKWVDHDSIGAPIIPMLNRVKRWLSAGEDVRIFTARVFNDGTPEGERKVREATAAIEKWCKLHLGRTLPVTCSKDHNMRVLYDDRAIQVRPNTGILVGDEELL